MIRVARSAGAVAVAVCAILAFLLLTDPAAAAARCGAHCPSLSWVPGATRAGAHLTVAGRGFDALHRIRIIMGSSRAQVGAARADSAGAFRTSVTLPRRVRSTDALLAVDAATGQQARRRLGGASRALATAGYLGVVLIGLAAIGVVLLAGSTLLIRTGRHPRATA